MKRMIYCAHGLLFFAFGCALLARPAVSFHVLLQLQKGDREMIALIPAQECHKQRCLGSPQERYYQVTLLEDIMHVWHDRAGPETVACFPLTYTFQDDQKRVVTLRAPQHVRQKTVELTLEPDVVMQQAYLINDNLLREFNLDQYAVELDQITDLSYLDEYFGDHDSQEVKGILDETDTAAPSKLMVYMRQVGVALLLRYIHFKEYMSELWEQYKQYI